MPQSIRSLVTVAKVRYARRARRPTPFANISPQEARGLPARRRRRTAHHPEPASAAGTRQILTTSTGDNTIKQKRSAQAYLTNARLCNSTSSPPISVRCELAASGSGCQNRAASCCRWQSHWADPPPAAPARTLREVVEQLGGLLITLLADLSLTPCLKSLFDRIDRYLNALPSDFSPIGSASVRAGCRGRRAVADRKHIGTRLRTRACTIPRT
jgi:hypothetical protein